MTPAPFPDPIIYMKDVAWRRDGSYILRGINWTVKPGEHWAIIGLNGSGKTSLLNMIGGYSFPSEGEVSVFGNIFGSCDIRGLRRSIGIVNSSLQESLYPDDTPEEIILSGRFASIGLYDSPSPSDRRKAFRLLKQFGCSALAGREYSTLSQGEKQKVLVARALMGNPKLLILDEPCTGLDLIAREEFLEFVTKVEHARRDITILCVSHHVEEILPIFTHSLLLRDGRIHSSGKTREVLTESNLTDFYRLRTEIDWRNDRPWIRIVG